MFVSIYLAKKAIKKNLKNHIQKNLFWIKKSYKMKKSLLKIVVAIVVLLSTTMNAQIKNAKTETIKIYGNCGMCEKTIETAGNLKKVVSVDWDKETKMATIIYDAKKTNQDEILKRIALAGYDSDRFLAPDDVYNNLHGCCQYDRESKIMVKEPVEIVAVDINEVMPIATSSTHDNHHETAAKVEIKKNDSQLNAVYNAYFAVKEALVKTDYAKVKLNSKMLSDAIAKVDMGSLTDKSHMAWMKALKPITENASSMATAKNIDVQRKQFTNLSVAMYDLLKVAKTDEPIYYQKCPMANDGKGGTWLSKESAVKNPYYGSMMLSCGSVIDTIK